MINPFFILWKFHVYGDTKTLTLPRCLWSLLLFHPVSIQLDFLSCYLLGKVLLPSTLFCFDDAMLWFHLPLLCIFPLTTLLCCQALLFLTVICKRSHCLGMLGGGGTASSLGWEFLTGAEMSLSNLGNCCKKGSGKPQAGGGGNAGVASEVNQVRP